MIISQQRDYFGVEHLPESGSIQSDPHNLLQKYTEILQQTNRGD